MASSKEKTGYLYLVPSCKLVNFEIKKGNCLEYNYINYALHSFTSMISLLLKYFVSKELDSTLQGLPVFLFQRGDWTR